MDFEWHGTRLHYETEGCGRPMLCIHGMGCCLSLMRGCMEPVFAQREASAATGRPDAQAWRRIYVDLPGMGKSGADLSLASAAGIVGILFALMDEIAGDEPFALAGQSFGGYLALRMMLEHPERVMGLHLLCPLIDPESRPYPPRENAVALVRDEEYLASLGEAARASFLRNAVVADADAHQRFVEQVAPGFSQIDAAFYEALMGRCSLGIDMRAAVAEASFGKPALIVCGRQDSVVGCQVQRPIADAMPHATFAILDIAGHNLQIERPQLYGALVSDWLDRMA